MKIIVFNEKGGSGKTTLSVSLSVKMAAPMIDMDPQGTATKWLQRRPEGFEFIDSGDADLSPGWVADCRPLLALREGAPLFPLADIVIIPVRASFPDLVTMDATVRFLSLHCKRIAFCGSDIDTRTADVANLNEGLASFKLPLLGYLSHRASYRRAGINGKTAAEIDKVAASELDAIIKKTKELVA